MNFPTKKIGQTSGITDGYITHSSLSVSVNYGTESEPDFITINNTFRFSNPSLSGDSGGPVYYNNGSQLLLIGMNFAGPSDPSVATYGIACRIFDVMFELDITPITKGGMFVTSDVNTGEIRIDGGNYIPPDNVIVIPEKINGRTVTRIEKFVFSGCSNLATITGMEHVTSIGEYAFSDCESLENIYLSNKTETIGYYAFNCCNALTIYAQPQTRPEDWAHFGRRTDLLKLCIWRNQRIWMLLYSI